MALIAKQAGGSFIPCPAGLHHAVCVDVVDLGDLKVNYGGKEKIQHKVRLVWQTDELMPDGKPYIVQKRYTLSLNEKATLRKDLESWRSKAFTVDELNGFDLELLLCVNCQLNVIQETRDGSTYGNVTSIVPPPKGVQKLVSHGYLRVKDRTDKPEDDDQRITDDDVPF